MTHKNLSPAGEYGLTLLVVAVTTLFCLALRSRINVTDIAMIFLLGVVLVASLFRQGPALLATVLSVAGFDFLFVPPYYVFNVHDTSYYLTFGVMLLVALAMGRLTNRIREQAEEAGEREERTAALYAMSQELSEAASHDAVLAVAARHLGQAAGGRALILPAAELGSDSSALRLPSGGIFEEVGVRVAAQWAHEHREAAGSGTRHSAAVDALVVPLKVGSNLLGLVVVDPQVPDRRISRADARTVQALADQAALVLEHGTVVERARK
jgi:two-component system sensor histidine kinase KdpD